MIRKAFVLLSGGVDSSTCLYAAKDKWDDVEAVSIDYGQRHRTEIRCAQLQAKSVKAAHRTLVAHDVLRGSMLTEKDTPIPDTTYAAIKGVSPTYVPFRNGTLLAIIAAHAQKWVDQAAKTHALDDIEAAIYFGAHAEDAQNWAYPDCTPEFIGAMANAIYIGTYMRVRLIAPLMHMSKAEVVTLGAALGVNFANTWSCYAGGEAHCGKCPTCYARQHAFDQAGVIDPTEYAAPRKVA
jgi:7-cyano-7-deazaguanine synthase